MLVFECEGNLITVDLYLHFKTLVIHRHQLTFVIVLLFVYCVNDIFFFVFIHVENNSGHQQIKVICMILIYELLQLSILILF